MPHVYKFSSIFHNIKSDIEYEEYKIGVQQPVRQAAPIALGDSYDPRRGTSNFLMIYEENLWVRLFPASTKRCEPTPEYFRDICLK
jgi:hypothetical protein